MVASRRRGPSSTRGNMQFARKVVESRPSTSQRAGGESTPLIGPGTPRALFWFAARCDGWDHMAEEPPRLEVGGGQVTAARPPVCYPGARYGCSCTPCGDGRGADVIAIGGGSRTRCDAGPAWVARWWQARGGGRDRGRRDRWSRVSFFQGAAVGEGRLWGRPQGGVDNTASRVPGPAQLRTWRQRAAKYKYERVLTLAPAWWSPHQPRGPRWRRWVVRDLSRVAPLQLLLARGRRGRIGANGDGAGEREGF